MDYNQAINELANLVGISDSYSDISYSEPVYTSFDTKIALLKALGFNTDENKITQELLKEKQRLSKQILDDVYVIRKEDYPYNLAIYIPKDKKDMAVNMDIIEEGKKEKHSYGFSLSDLEVIEETEHHYKLEMKIFDDLPYGYHNLKLVLDNKLYSTSLVITPSRCYISPSIENDKKVWGFPLQLYSVKSKRNWGVGDFTDLLNMIKFAKNNGADVIGLNPLNTLFHDFPHVASPYSSISRLFLNPIYIDVENIGSLSKIKEVDTYFANSKLQKKLEELRKTHIINYPEVYKEKITALEHIFSHLDKDKNTKKEFEKYCKDKGTNLDNFATFQTLYEYMNKKGIEGGYRAWEADYKKPNSKKTKDFKTKHKSRINFFKFMQYLAETQLGDASKLASDLEMGIGIYQDLAVGVNTNSAEFWGDSKNFFKKASCGAPPDVMNPQPQAWGLGAFSPLELKKRCYQPLVDIIRSNMKTSGALRFDHVMLLQRLFVIPDGKAGAYIYYPFKDLLGIIALESERNKCVVVGESIGNVPAGFLETLDEWNFMSLSVLYCEKYDMGHGGFKAPYDYTVNSVSSVGTHDMASLYGWWKGTEIQTHFDIGNFDEGTKEHCYKEREKERQKLLTAIDNEEAWPVEYPRYNSFLFGRDIPKGLNIAVHRYLARSVSKIFLCQLEDIFESECQVNLPGTYEDEKHPNWRRKLSVDLEDYENHQTLQENIKAIKNER